MKTTATKSAAESQPRAFAVWEYGPDENVPKPESLVISCGVGEQQYEGYYHDADGARVTYEPLKGGGTRVTFSAPSLRLEKRRGYWLSPDDQDTGASAARFGITRRSFQA